MAFVVEDGTGLATANSYNTIAFLDEYHTDRGNSSWVDESIAIKQAKAIIATDYIDVRFNYLGQKLKTTQALEFPRENLFLNGVQLEGVPDIVKKAHAELALISLTQTLFNTPSTSEAGLLLTKERTRVGPIEEEFEYDPQLGVRTVKDFPIPDRLLERLSGGPSSNSIFLARG